MVFVPRPGIFKSLCADAAGDPGRQYFLIVDEINRGDIPRIFGELITVIERDKRGKHIILPVSRELFAVPANVYLIGTMNTADRSISLLDTALRRRFAFIEIMPDSSVLSNIVIQGIPLGSWLDALNSRIRMHVGRDARNLQIGHSYLMEDGHPVRDIASLARAIREDIIPLVQEYCYEDFVALEAILGKGFVDAAGQRLEHGVFDRGKEEDLARELLATCPEITTLPEVVRAESDASEDAAEENEDEEVAER
jgi:GTPase subunit of restriction endonuclease